MGGLPFGHEFFRRLLDNLYDGVYFVDLDRRILYWNRGAEQITGYRREEVLGSHRHDLILDHTDADGNHLCLRACPLARTIEDGKPRTARLFLRHKDGRRIAVDAHIMPVVDDDGRTVGGVEVFRDASSAVALEGAYEQLRELAERDPLTGAANRRQLEAELQRQAALLAQTGVPFSVVMADLDRFKEVNDTYGHAAGDQALVGFAAVLLRASRPTDLVARYGGEEFLVVLPGQGIEVATVVAERFRLLTPEATPPAMGPARLSASFGVTEAAPGDRAGDLVARADVALYRAKRGGRNRVVRGDGPPGQAVRSCPS
jgi:diguanylate cyclase (GGDEF)-like protein/PAS domain S-box-containing protein